MSLAIGWGLHLAVGLGCLGCSLSRSRPAPSGSLCTLIRVQCDACVGVPICQTQEGG